jgi:hypothetical protein
LLVIPLASVTLKVTVSVVPTWLQAFAGNDKTPVELFNDNPLTVFPLMLKVNGHCPPETVSCAVCVGLPKGLEQDNNSG